MEESRSTAAGQPKGNAAHKPYRIVIWGAAFEYATVANAIFDLVAKGQGTVVGITANSLPPSGTVDGFRIIQKSDLRTLDFDVLLCCINGDAREVVSEISGTYGIPREKIVRSSVMHQPYFDFGRYMELRESNVTIITNNCWGGFMYQMLDLQCVSPFRNLYLVDKDYLRLLTDIRGYCSKELEFSRIDLDKLGIPHPVMRLGDVEIHFNHAKTPEEAFEQWNRRLTRMNWDNLFVMMQTTNKDREHEFNQIADSVGFKKCICFVPHETSEPHSMRIHIRPSDRYFFDAVNATGINRGGSYPFNAIKLLMGDPDYVRYVPDDPEEAEDMPCRG